MANDGEPKAVNVEGYETRKDLVYDKISMKSRPCERFSIRGYAAEIRQRNINKSWPFDQHLLETSLNEALPALEIPKYRWWKDCGITTSENPIEKAYMSGTQVSVKDYDGNINGERGIFGTRFPASSAEVKEKQKQNMLDHRTEIVETLTFGLKSGDVVGCLAYEIDKREKDEEVVAGIITERERICDLKSRDPLDSIAYEIDREGKDEEVVTGILTEHGITESTVPMNKSEFVDTQKKNRGTSHCLSNCGEMEKSEMETVSSMLVRESNEELDYKQNKSKARQIPFQASSSWEYFDRNNNVFKEISEKVKENEMEHPASSILAFDNSFDASETKSINNVPVSNTSGENLEGVQEVGSYEGVQEVGENRVPCFNGNEGSCPEHMIIKELQDPEVTENNEQLPPKDSEVTVKMSAKPTRSASKTHGISEVNIGTAMNYPILKKQSSTKVNVRKNHPGRGIQYKNTDSAFCEKNSSTPSLSEALQFTQGTTHLTSISRDKALQSNLLNPEYGQRRQEFPAMEDKIPVAIVELMAKLQHERGLSNPKHIYKNHDLQKDGRGLKRKKIDPSHVNKHIQEGRTGLKQDTVTPKSKAYSKPTGEENLQTSLRNYITNDLLVDNGHTYVSGVSATDNSCISDKEGITPGSCKDHPALLQSTQWFNLWGKYSPGFVAPSLDETNAACDQYGSFTTDSRALDSMRLKGASITSGYMETQKLHREGTPALSYCTDPVFPGFQNISEPSIYFNGYSHQKLTNTNSPRNLPSKNTDIGGSRSKFGILSQNHKRNGIPNVSVRTDVDSGSLYLHGQSNSALLQRVNAEATQIFRKNNFLPTPPVLRLMGQNIPVLANCGIKNMATENSDNKNFSNLPECSSQNHVSWFHPETCTSSVVMDRHRRQTFTGTERVFTGLSPIHVNTYMNEEIISSVKTITTVPKFRDSHHHVSNGYSGTFAPSYAVTGRAGVNLEPYILRTTSPFDDPGKRRKTRLPCTNDEKSNLQNLTKDTGKAKDVRLNKELEEPALCVKNACDMEICALNQNPAEIIIDNEEDGYSFGYKHLRSSRRALSHIE